MSGSWHTQLRRVFREPAFLAVMVVPLAVAIAVSTTIFTLAYRFLVQPLPLPEPDELVLLWESNPEDGVDVFPVSPANFLDWRQEREVFEGVAAVRRASLDVTGGREPERVSGAAVTADFFRVTGVSPLVGRALDAGDADQPRVVVAHGLWQRRLGGRRDLASTALEIDGRRWEVVGVMPPSFRTPSGAEIWQPLAFAPEEAAERSGRSLVVYARLRSGVSRALAAQRLSSLAERLAADHPEANSGWTTRMVPLHEQLMADVRPGLLMLLAGVGFVLLVAFTNVTNLLVARSQRRRGEWLMRTALGEPRRRLARSIVLESVLLTLLAAVLGVAGAALLLRLVVRLAGDGLPVASEPGLSAWPVAATLLLVLGSSAAVALLPLNELRGLGLRGALDEAAERHDGSARRHRLRRGLIVLEIAVALLLTIGAGLLIRSYQRLQAVDPGFRAESVLTFRANLSERRYPEQEQWPRVFEAITAGIARLPGVAAVGVGAAVPFSGAQLFFDFLPEGQPLDAGERPSARYNPVAGDYFAAMGIPVLSGRVFTPEDRPGAPAVVVVSEGLARRHWPQGAVGQHLRVADSQRELLQIVGVVGDVKAGDLGVEAEPMIYRPLAQDPWEFATFVVHTRADPQALVRDVRGVVASVDRDQPIYEVKTLEARLADTLLQRRLQTTMVGVFALVALALAVAGVYGLISVLVGQRIRELGLRLALGADRGDIVRLVLGQVLRLVLAGVAVGLAGAFLLTRFLDHLVYGIHVFDPATVLGLALLLALVAVAAGLVPVRRVLRLDPTQALRRV